MNMNQETKQCQNCTQPFVIEPEDFAFYAKVQVPPPTFCPDCRYQRRLANRNEWNFYKRDCSLCGKSMVSIYNPDYPGPVYCQPCWWSDKWDPYAYGQAFDFSRPFFDQFQELRIAVPHIAMANWHSTNSEYTNQSVSNKNCYMCVSTAYSEDCLYAHWNDKVRESVDCYGVIQCELLYKSLNSDSCSNSAYLEDCADTTMSYFLKDCRGCTSCFRCYGLRNKSYCWGNEQLTKKDYEKRFSEFIFSRTNIKQERESLIRLAKKYPHKNYHGRNALHTVGDYTHDVKDAFNVFNASEAENIRYCQDARYSKDSFDCTEVWVELGYENEGVTAQGCIAVTKSVKIFSSFYSELCSNSHDLFGCVGLNKAEYCILNRRYEKSEYERIRGQIIEHMKAKGEWGEFFPAHKSLFGYNETIAQDYFPLNEGEVTDRGLRWYHHPVREYKISMSCETIPETIKEVSDAILQDVIECSSRKSDKKGKYFSCTSAFRITEAELGFYRKMNMPLPSKCFACRRQERMEMRNPRKLWKRSCQCVALASSNGVYKNQSPHFHDSSPCPNEFQTSYAPDRPEIVYCEQCYQAEIV